MGLSMSHMIILLVVVLIIFGPGRLPSLGKSLGEAIRGFKKGISGDGDIDVSARNDHMGRPEQIRQSVQQPPIPATTYQPETVSQSQSQNQPPA